MQIESYNCFNPNAKGKIDLSGVIRQEFEKANSVFKYLSKLKAEIMNEYLSSFKERLDGLVGDYQIAFNSLNVNDVVQDLTYIHADSDLQALIIRFICKNLEIEDFPDQNESEILYYNQSKASCRLSYHRVKVLEDLLGKEEATQLYKDVVTQLILEMKKKSPTELPGDPREVTRIASRKRYIEWSHKTGLGDFTLGIFDDYKEIYRFDRCVVHEVLKDFNDPDIAYLSSCYKHENPEWNKGEIIHLGKTQTLHHGDLCDELYWNNEIHPNTEQPSLEFTKELSPSA
ncbi:MAG: hypothetical protein ACXADX_13815 [Candidatus Hodarchaeales archaeon]|jgi:hypothetical protein